MEKQLIKSFGYLAKTLFLKINPVKNESSFKCMLCKLELQGTQLKKIN